jgi:hypothetical protein
MTPATDLGKIAVAIYAIVSVNVVVALLVPARQYLEGFCRVEEVVNYSDTKLAWGTYIMGEYRMVVW